MPYKDYCNIAENKTIMSITFDQLLRTLSKHFMTNIGMNSNTFANEKPLRLNLKLL